MRRRLHSFLLATAAACLLSADAPKSVEADKEALKPLQAYVGGWKGVGQPKRGSAAGAWTEECEWAWQYKGGRAELVARSSDSKFFSQLQLQPGEMPGAFVLLVTPAADKAAERYLGVINDDGYLVLTAAEPKSERPARITMRMVAGGDRLLVLYEGRAAGDFVRLAEVGSTRKGISFAKGSGYPECIVTGGQGTIAVEHKGQTYHVCCTGCRDLFQEDPEGVLAEYRARKAKEKK